MHADMIDVIRSYRSEILDQHPRGAHIYPVIQNLVIAAEPPDAKVARQALLRCAQFYAWHTSRDPGTVTSTALTDDHISEFIDDTLADAKTGTRDATRSFLRRSVAGRTLARTGRHGDESNPQTGTTTRKPERSPSRREVAANAPPFPPNLTATDPERRQQRHDGNAAVTAACESWAPADMDPADWAPLRPTCLDWVAAVAPTSVQRARVIMLNSAWLLLWARDQKLPAADVLTIAAVKAYLADEEITGPTAESIRSTMNAVIAAFNPDATWGQREHTTRTGTAPYSDDQIEWFWERTRHMGNRPGRSARALLALGAAYGVCRGATPSTITNDDIRTDGDTPTLLVRQGPQTLELPAVERWASHVRGVLDETGAGHLLGTTNPKRSTQLADTIGAVSGQGFSLVRLRANWMLHIMCTDISVATAADAADMRTLGAFDAVTPYLAAHRGRPLGATS
jgi:hypothetical protein